jgi:hypothetical protein
MTMEGPAHPLATLREVARRNFRSVSFERAAPRKLSQTKQNKLRGL